MQQPAQDGSPWVRFSQSEDLTVRLRNILHDYAFGPGIFRELLQNADDARATRLVLLADGGSYSRQGLLDDRLASWQGPAVCAFNDAPFSDADFEGICRVGASVKRGDETKIGHYGLGFNSCYHLSDVVSFTSRDRLCIFDPHERHLPGDLPGLQMPLGREEVERYAGQVAPFMEVAQACGVSLWPLEGAIFRLPLRTPEMAAESQICPESHSFHEAVQVLEELLRSAQDLLLFLQSVQRLEVMVRHPSSGAPSWRLLGSASLRVASGELSARLRRERRLTDSAGSVKVMRRSMAFTVDVHTDLNSQGPHTTSVTWLLARRCESWQPTEREKKQELPSHRHSAVALQLWPFQPEENVQGQAFCFLPLSLNTGLPVHVCANFAISANRRDLWRRSDDNAASVGNLRAAWNEAILDQTLVRAYADVLEALASEFPGGEAEGQQAEPADPPLVEPPDAPCGAMDFLDSDTRQQVQETLLCSGEHLWAFWPRGGTGSFELLPRRVAQELLARQAAVLWSAGVNAFRPPRSALLCSSVAYAALEEAMRSALAKLQLAGCRRSLVEVPASVCETLSEKGAAWLQPQSLATALRAAPPALSVEEADAVVSYLLAPGGQGPLTVLHGLHLCPLLPAVGCSPELPSLGCFTKPEDAAASKIWWADDAELQELVPGRPFADPASRTFKLLKPRLQTAPLNIQVLNAKSLPGLLPGLFPEAWKGRGEVRLADDGSSVLLDGRSAEDVQQEWDKSSTKTEPSAKAARGGSQAKVPVSKSGKASRKTGAGKRGAKQQMMWDDGADDYGDWDEWNGEEWMEEDYGPADPPWQASQSGDAKGSKARVEVALLPTCTCKTVGELKQLVRRCKLLWQLAERSHEKGTSPMQLLSDLPCIPVVGAGDVPGAPALLSLKAAEQRKPLALEDFTQQERAILESCGCLFIEPVRLLRKALGCEKASMLAALFSAFEQRFTSDSENAGGAAAWDSNRLFRGLKPRRIPLEESLPVRQLIRGLLQRRLIPNDAKALERLPIFETLGGEVAVTLTPATSRIMAPTEDWDEILLPVMPNFLPSWRGEAGEFLKEIGRERGSLVSFLAEFCGPRLGQLSQAVCVRFLEAVASLGNSLWRNQAVSKDHARVAQFCQDAPLVVFLDEEGAEASRCRCSALADPCDSALGEYLGGCPPEPYCSPVVLSVMRKAGLRSMSDPEVFLEVARKVELSARPVIATEVLLKYLASWSEVAKWPSKTFTALARLRIYPVLKASVMQDAMPPDPAASSGCRYVDLDAPCVLPGSAEVAWTQVPILDPRTFNEWPPSLIRCFSGIKTSPPIRIVLDNLVTASGRWADSSSPQLAELTATRQEVVAKHLELLAVQVKRSHINQVMAQTSLAMAAFVVLDDGRLVKPCDIFTALHDGSSDEEGSSQPRPAGKQKGSRRKSAWSLPKYLRPYRRFLLAVAGPMVDTKKEIPMISVCPAPESELVFSFITGALNRAELADVEFAVCPPEGGPPKFVYAHRVVLAATCEHFKSAFSSGFSAKPGPEGRHRVEMPEWVEVRPLLWLFAYLYHGFNPEKAWDVARQLDSGVYPDTKPEALGRPLRGAKGRLPKLQDDELGDDLCGLLRLSEFYDLEHLKQWTEKRLQGLLTAENVTHMCTHAFFCNATQLLPLCVYHMQVMYADLVGAEAWDDLDDRIKELVLEQVKKTETLAS